jgi:hypothetical protein
MRTPASLSVGCRSVSPSIWNAAATIAGYVVQRPGADWLYLSAPRGGREAPNGASDVVIIHSSIRPRGGRAGLDARARGRPRAGLGACSSTSFRNQSASRPVVAKSPLVAGGWRTHGRWGVTNRARGLLDVDWDFARTPSPEHREPHLAFEIIDGELAYYEGPFPLAPDADEGSLTVVVVHSCLQP